MDRTREYEELANAIVTQATRDYREACLALVRIRDRPALDPLRIKWERQKNSCLTFFHSAWYKKLTGLDPDYLVKQLNKEISEYEKWREKHE